MGVEGTDRMDVAVKVKVGDGEEKGDSQTQERRETARGGLGTQHFWSLQNKAPESVTSHCRCGRKTAAGGRGPPGASCLRTGGLLDQGYLPGWETP